MSRFDQVDEHIIQLLAEDAHRSTKEIAARLSISASTVRRRIRSLLQKRTLRIIAVPNPYQTGVHVNAMIALKVDRDKIDEVARTLERRSTCRWVSSAAGMFDVLAIEWLSTTDDLADFIQDIAKLPGVRDIETFICLHVYKGSIRTA